MPILKSYTTGPGHYIHASVRGSVVTFQTTKRGVEKLTAAGVQIGVRFSLRLLADLTRSGDAFTHRGGIEFYEAEQFEFDFKESQESESLFPACSVTGTFDDLHLVAYENGGEKRVELLAPSAREKVTEHVMLSVPLSILCPSALATLEATEQLPANTPAVAALRRWYAEDASAEWERLRREREARQQGFSFDVPGELKL
jgi:hypothetical protein